MSNNYKKIDKLPLLSQLRDFILGWIHKEASQDSFGPHKDSLDRKVYEKRRKNLNMLASSDIEYLNKIIREYRWNKLTKAEMQKCNALKKKYLAISNVEFEEVKE
jgi:hypothetical protein